MFTETITARRPRLARRLLASPLAQALTTPHGVDRYVELVKPAFSLRDVRAEIVAVRCGTPGSVTLTLRPNENWRGFRAGQHVLFSIEIDGVRHTRPYSPAGSEHDPELIELTAHAQPGGRVSPRLADLDPGDVVGLSQAQGDFALPASRPRELLLISGGSGITPVMAMLRTLCDEGHRGPIAFLHYARGARHVAYDAELRELAVQHRNVRLLRSFTGGGALSNGELTGRLTREHVAAAGIDPAEAETFVCGPTALVDAVHELWAQDGLEERLHVERFAPPAPVADPGAAGIASGAIRFARSGAETANSGGTLLDQAEAAGLTPQSGCRMGICHTCSCRKLEGAVRDVRTGEVSTAPDEQIQICVTVPVGDVTLDI